MESYFTQSYSIEAYEEKLKRLLRKYVKKEILQDGSVKETVVEDDYLLSNDHWEYTFFLGIPQFRERLLAYKENPVNHIFVIKFDSTNRILNLEMKCLYKMKLFSGEWEIYSAFQKHTHRYRVFRFMEQFYTNTYSLKELCIEEAEEKYINWLKQTGIPVTEKRTYRYGRPDRIGKIRTAGFLKAAYNSIMHYLDDRNLWDRDIWRVRDFEEQLDFEFNKSTPQGYIRFDTIKNTVLKQTLKLYIKDRLLGKRHLSWGTGQQYARTMSRLFQVISPYGNEKGRLRNLSRDDILQFIEWIRKHYKENKRKGVDNHLSNCMGQITTFIQDLQHLGHQEAPYRSVHLIINNADFPKYTQKRRMAYIPDPILEQLFSNISYLHPEVTPIIWIAFKTGLRISDVLTLTEDCLLEINGDPYLETDISKTKVHRHRIPIDNHLKDIIQFLVEKSKTETNRDNNPLRFLFVRLTGSRRGKPFQQGFVRNELNALAITRNIKKENGEIFHFRMHEFRHTYAVKLLNNGVDIFTVQELLAHASPEMTMVYAKLLDDTKRKEFEKVMATGTFEFTQNGQLEKIDNDSMDPEALASIWQNHKLHAIDNPYGTCLARLKGQCPFINEPPCLSCNGGHPCKDLAIGLSELDREKYQLHIRTSQRMIEQLKKSRRNDMAEKNQQLLDRYIAIANELENGAIIYSRQERLFSEKENE